MRSELTVLLLGVLDATESGVVARGQRFRMVAGGRAVAQAIVEMAKKGSALGNVQEHQFVDSGLRSGASAAQTEFLQFNLRDG